MARGWRGCGGGVEGIPFALHIAIGVMYVCSEKGYLVQHWLQVQASRIRDAPQVCHQAVVQKGSICCKSCMP